jgi:hypothetical protein
LQKSISLEARMISLGEVDAYLWGCVPGKVDTLVEKCASPAWDIRNATSSVYTKNDVGYYWNPHLQKAGVYFRPHYDIEEGGWCKAALDRAVGSEHVRTKPLSLGDVSDGSWVKVAYSPTLRRAGEYLNFFPWPGKENKTTWLGVKPTPLSGMLTSGLVGAGLGYGLGWLGEKMLPDNWKKGRLRKALAVIGGLGGAAPGLGLMGANLMAGDSANSDTFLSGDDFEGGRTDNLSYKRSADEFIKKAFGMSSHAGDVPPVNINKLGQTLWEVGASPQTAAATMSSVYAAQQLPGGVGPGYVTPHQTGLLGTMMGAAGGGLQGYAVGWGVGKGLGILTGMPTDTQNTLKRTGAVLGVIDTLVPRLFR